MLILKLACEHDRAGWVVNYHRTRSDVIKSFPNACNLGILRGSHGGFVIDGSIINAVECLRSIVIGHVR